LKIVACFKAVPEEKDITINSDNRLSFDRAEWKVGLYDLNAVEAGVRLTEDMGEGEISVLTAGGSKINNSKLKKAILARGASQLYGVCDDSLESIDSYATAQILSAALKQIGDVDLVLCGEGSGDVYSQQVGPALGQLLGYVNLNAVSKIQASEGKLIVERSLETEVEVLEISLPAVLSVTTDINKPRIPGLKEIMAAGKKPVTMWGLSDLAAACTSKTEIVSTLAPESKDRCQIIFEGDSEENINALYEQIRKVM